MLPIYSPSAALSLNMFKVLGRIIVHSVLQEGPGFPFFAPAIYKYICTGSAEEAVDEVELEDLPTQFAEMINKVLTV